MNPTNHLIQLVARRDIEEDKWNDCVKSQPNGLIYANTQMLDSLSPGWDALVWQNYKAIMPLTNRRKFGISYLYQPAFAAMLGIIGDLSSNGIVADFVRAIPSEYKFVDIQFNETNLSQLLQENLTFRIRRNLLLELTDYNSIASNYKRLANRMLAKAREMKIEIKSGAPAGELIDYYKRNYSKSHSQIVSQDYEALLRACNSQFGKDHLVTYQACSPEGEILAVYLLFRDHKYVYSVLGGSIKAGKEAGAFYLLTDRAIQDHCGQNKVFRFEGSDEEGIAFFDSQFGATEINYPHLILNRLPWLLKWIKPNK